MSHGLLSLSIAAIAFCGSHIVLSSTWLRGSLRDQLGERGFLAVYSLTALVTFAWFLVAYSHAPTIPLWPRQRWTALVPVVVMPLATILLIAQAVLSWLVAFGVVNRYNRAVATIGDFLWRVTEPLLRPIRRVIPDLGGIDISPVILILLLWFLRDLMFEYLV